MWTKHLLPSERKEHTCFNLSRLVFVGWLGTCSGSDPQPQFDFVSLIQTKASKEMESPPQEELSTSSSKTDELSRHGVGAATWGDPSLYYQLLAKKRRRSDVNLKNRDSSFDEKSRKCGKAGKATSGKGTLSSSVVSQKGWIDYLTQSYRPAGGGHGVSEHCSQVIKSKVKRGKGKGSGDKHKSEVKKIKHDDSSSKTLIFGKGGLKFTSIDHNDNDDHSKRGNGKSSDKVKSGGKIKHDDSSSKKWNFGKGGIKFISVDYDDDDKYGHGEKANVKLPKTSMPTSAPNKISNSPSHDPMQPPQQSPTLGPSFPPSNVVVLPTDDTIIIVLIPSRKPSNEPSINTTSFSPIADSSVLPSSIPSSLALSSPTMNPADFATARPSSLDSGNPSGLPSEITYVSLIPSRSISRGPSTILPQPTSISPSIGQSIPSPTQSPTKVVTTLTPTLTPPPSLLPSQGGEGIRVVGTPFTLEYDLGADGGLPSDLDNAVAITMEHLKTFLDSQFMLNPLLTLLDLSYTVQDSNLNSNPVSVTYQVTLIFEDNGMDVPGPQDADVLFFTAFSPPSVQELITNLAGSGAEFSQTNNVNFVP